MCTIMCTTVGQVALAAQGSANLTYHGVQGACGQVGPPGQQQRAQAVAQRVQRADQLVGCRQGHQSLLRARAGLPCRAICPHKMGRVAVLCRAICSQEMDKPAWSMTLERLQLDRVSAIGVLCCLEVHGTPACTRWVVFLPEPDPK